MSNAGVPVKAEAGGDGVEVAQEVLSKLAKAGQVGGGASRFDPCRELVALQVGEHVGEGAHVLGERCQFGAVGQGGFERDPVAFG
ncbi:hypothetical protein [Streptomyces sp. Root369]|uniref:hypothetical protein n=1 Tax=Streptomyces sp. Root369 TaxID=1736523 RepID=UPI0013018FCE|nr:hypothetical protein [Streptomyces sp. Root369]